MSHRLRVSAVFLCFWSLAGLAAHAETTCPAHLVDDDFRHGGVSDVVESTLPRISLEEAARRVVADGAHVIKYVSLRGHCLRIYKNPRDGAAQGAALVENATGAQLAVHVRALQPPQIFGAGSYRFATAWQLVQRVDGSGFIDGGKIDYVSDQIEIDQTEAMGLLPDGFDAPEADPMRNAYFVADTREMIPLSYAGPQISYRHSGGLYVFDAKNRGGTVSNWREQMPIGYDSQTLARQGEAYQQSSLGLVAYFSSDSVAEAMMTSPEVRRLVQPETAYLLAHVTDYLGFDLLMSRLREGYGPWRGNDERNGFIENYAFLAFDPQTLETTFEIAIPSGRDTGWSGDFSLTRVQLRLPLGAGYIPDTARAAASEVLAGGFYSWRARMTPAQVEALDRNDDPFASREAWHWSQLD